MAGAGSDLAITNFIALSVVQYLGVCSLFSFAATVKSLWAVFSREIEHRKTCIVEIDVNVKELMAPHQNQSGDLAGTPKEKHTLKTFSEFQDEVQE
jgi:hypothetical protein